mmetsp:Transcript_8836/g.13685  ORF Transcript_8836/g.13685 Transcript_8836/m.13685 type:complete len:80 (+) Transcript_8836:804-1043(+)
MSAWVNFGLVVDSLLVPFVLSWSLILSGVANSIGDVDILAAVPTGDDGRIIIFVVAEGATTMNASDVHDVAVSNSNTVA